MDQERLKIIEDNPIGEGLDKFRENFHKSCPDAATQEGLESLNENGSTAPDLHVLAVELLLVLASLQVSRLLPPSGHGNHLRADLTKLALTIDSNEFDLDRIKPLLRAVIAENTVDALVWKQIYAVITESTPPPQTIASSSQQTPCLGFDPTIVSSEGRRYIEIERNGQTERLIIDELIKRAPCVAGRATMCWKAHRDGDDTPLVIKDSWQYPERDEEGKLLQEATDNGVRNVARYYHHETVRIGGSDDDVLRDAENHHAENSKATPASTADSAQRNRGTSITRRKRPSSYTDTPLPPSKRSCSTSPVKQ
ncbi:hypothetical protein IL306_007718 [Fusarium sp. DS 682]|nr:hypothetical protein IL306_007718 [Fusarium sp. DS 682]